MGADRGDPAPARRHAAAAGQGRRHRPPRKEAKNIAKVAAARELLTLVFYGMRDGHIRRASRPGQAA